MKIFFFMCHKIFVVFFTCAILLPEKIIAEDELVLKNLKTEYRTNPIGVDVIKPRFSWEIHSDRRNTVQTSYEIRCANTKENLVGNGDLLWCTKINSGQSTHVIYDGPELQSRQRVYWQVKVWDNHGRVSKWSEAVFWEMGLLDKNDWKAQWIEADIKENIDISQPAQYFRRQFNATGKIKSARLYITCHGLYEAYINNQLVSDQVFTPGWTSYNKRLQYQVYDISDLLSEGSNTIGVIIGDGWYRGYLGWKDRRNVYGEKVALLAQLEMTYEDGIKETIITDDSWKVSNNGPIVISDIYMGETYDARKKMIGWATSGYDDAGWERVIIKDHPRNNLVASFGPPIRKIEEIKPIRIMPKGDGSFIFDMGQNMVGWLRLKVSGERGTKIKLRHAEVLDKNGEFYTENLRSAKQTVVYICGGDNEEIYEPHFTFQGFRFVEMVDYPQTPDLESITGIVIHSDMTPTGNFVCSDSLINQLQHNIQWGLKGNFLDVPTDCPQRDERLGWTGDAQVFAPTACFNVDAASFYTKWLKDLALDQGEDGKVNDVIPDVLDGGGGHTGWADASVVVPWTVYLNYGDRRILENQYESMKSWIGYMKERAGENYLWQNDWHYGDWLSFDANSPAYMGSYTETDLIATAHFAYSTNLLSKIAQILGKVEDAEQCNNLVNNIKKAFLNEFVTPNGRLVSNTQTAYTLALSMDLLPPSLRKRVAENLYHNVIRFKHITTGFLGTPLICQTLTDCGYLEMAYLLLNRKEYPSWLYPVARGATTIWERWDGIKPDSTFQNPGMNSFNHYAYGAIGKWLYSAVAGIDIDEENPGYKNIIVNPQIGGSLTSAKAEINTMYGKAASEWEIEASHIKLKVTVPVNTTATVYLPLEYLSRVTVDDKPVASSNDVKIEKDHKDKAMIKTGSGTYVFTYPYLAVEKSE